MVLSKKSWYSEVYFFIQAWWAYSCNEKWDAEQFEKGSVTNSDICTFMRAFILKLPVLIISNVFMLWMMLFTFFLLPIHYLGFSGFFTAILIICGVIGIGVGVYYGEKKVSAYLKGKDTKPARTTPTFWEIFCAWVKGHHDNICVLMTFEKEPSDE